MNANHIRIACVLLLTAFSSGTSSVYAHEESGPSSWTAGTPADGPNSADQGPKKVDLTAKPHSAGKTVLQSLSLRLTFTSMDVVGSAAQEEFREYDVAATFKLPWSWYSQSGWGVGTRLMTSAGALYSSGETALAVSVIPMLAFGSSDGKFTLDMGAGGALLSKHQFGAQDFGAPFQFALTTGISFPIFRRLGLGYRFLHYSDAGLNGSDTTGADMHMLEMIYRF